VLPADIGEWDPEFTILSSADDRIAAQAHISNSGFVVDHFEPDVHDFCRRGGKGRAVHSL